MVENHRLVGRKLAVLARLKGLSQGRLAQACGISRVSVNRFFCGKSELRASDLSQILESLGIDLEDLIDRQLLRAMKGGVMDPMQE